MSTWQVFADAGNSYRWERTDAKLSKEPQETPIQRPSSPQNLPSIADLLLHGYSKLYEDENDKVETPPRFRTGSGKLVTAKQSSLTKASSILEGENTGFLKLNNVKFETPPTFQTGLGNSVAVKQSSSLKVTETGFSKLFEDSNDNIETPPTFKTGLGKSVAVKQSSLAKALSILGSQDDDAFADTGQLTERENGTKCSNSMFQTGSGKAVNISSTGLVKARTLLGLEENSDCEAGAFKGFEHTSKQANSRESFSYQTVSHPQRTGGETTLGFPEATSVSISRSNFQCGVYGGEIEEVSRSLVHTACKPPPLKFHTAGGRSVKVSGDALKRAMSILGDPDLGNFLKEEETGALVFSSDKNKILGLSNKENSVGANLPNDTPKNKQTSNNFISPILPTSFDKKSAVRLENIAIGNNLIKEFDTVENDTTGKQYNDMPCLQKPLTNRPREIQGARGGCVDNGIASKVNSVKRSSNGPFVDISNTNGMNNIDNGQVIREKMKLSSRTYPSPFKKPRNSKFVTPFNKKSTVVPNGTLSKAPEESCYRRRVSTRYPFQAPRKYIKEYLGVPPPIQNMVEYLPKWLRRMNPENAEKHTFKDDSGLERIGVDYFFHMFTQSWSSTVSKEWIANHYRWIVWKLACYERCYPTKFSGKLLTVSNVFEELKYRYEREANHGHRSALKRILEGDAPASSALLLCISSVQLKCNAESETKGLSTSNAADSATAASIELTDGWYSVNGLLDELLLKQLVAGKLFVGQKLRICGAGLSGWNAPVSPLEASRMISLRLHINGTYRAHWADRLGFCKSGCAPLAFKCIKGSGGVVPSTLIGVIRIYPVLYRERLSDGGFVVRSERMENKMMQLYDQRRSSIAEGIMSEFQRGVKSFKIDDEQNSGDEGVKISQLLEKAAEPEVLMAEMSSQQLTSFATYQAKVEATRQSEMEKSIEKALQEAGLSRREVTTLMRVRVVGLTSKSHFQKCCPRQGLITIWNPTEKQQSELVEGQAYAIAGLTPISSDSDTIYLYTRGSTTKWLPLSMSSAEQFQPFFRPRKPVLLSKMGEVPLSSEFDIAAFVIYVGEVFKSAHQKKQWVFVTDGSISSSHPDAQSGALLAISFCSPSIDSDSIVPINYNLVGSTVGFCNLIKKAKDQSNQIWMAEATENSTYFLSYDHANSLHLKEVAASADRLAKVSSSTIEKLKETISSIVPRKAFLRLRSEALTISQRRFISSGRIQASQLKSSSAFHLPR